MANPREQQVRAMRNLLTGARVENTRMVAAAIGGHLSRISRETGSPELAGASETVRDASLTLLKSLHQSEGVMRARNAALRSVDALEAALPGRSAGKGEPPSPARAGAERLKPLRKLTARSLSSFLAGRRP